MWHTMANMAGINFIYCENKAMFPYVISRVFSKKAWCHRVTMMSLLELLPLMKYHNTLVPRKHHKTKNQTSRIFDKLEIRPQYGVPVCFPLKHDTCIHFQIIVKCCSPLLKKPTILPHTYKTVKAFTKKGNFITVYAFVMSHHTTCKNGFYKNIHLFFNDPKNVYQPCTRKPGS